MKLRFKGLAIFLAALLIITALPSSLMAVFAEGEGESSSDTTTTTSAEETSGDETTGGSSVVAKIGDTEYTSLQAAFDAASGETTVTLQANITDVTTSISTTSESTVILDLNGYTISGSLSGGIITNNGTLTVQDSSDGAKGQIYNANSSGDSNEKNYSAIYNNSGSTLNIAGGTIGSSTTRANGIYNLGTVDVTGGKITAYSELRETLYSAAAAIFSYSTSSTTVSINISDEATLSAYGYATTVFAYGRYTKMTVSV